MTTSFFTAPTACGASTGSWLSGCSASRSSARSKAESRPGTKSLPEANDLHSLLVESALAEGFPLAGAIDISLSRTELAENSERYRDWVARGMHGALEYLVRGTDRRGDPSVVMPGAKSVFCVGIPYPRAPAGARSPAEGARYARYIQGPDYHEEIKAKLTRVMERVRGALAERGDPRAAALQFKVCVDTSAVLERMWAALAGLGWIGKNGLLIHPKHGSYLFIGEALLNLETGQGPRPIADYCGHCERCIESCPTRAIVAPRVVDSRRCISFVTLERRGPLSEIEPEVRAASGNWIAGCDICQEVCPWNLKPARAEEGAPVNAGATRVARWEELLAETEDAYRARIRQSSLSRVKPAQARRNLASALARSAREIPGARRSALAARARALLSIETDDAARAEWIECLRALEGEP